MKICSINLKYWGNIVNNNIKESIEDYTLWKNDIKKYLFECKNYLNKLDFDFILLQETFPIPLDNYNVYFHELAYELENEGVKKFISPNNSGWWGSSICINKKNHFINNIFYYDNYDLINGVYHVGSKFENGKIIFGNDKVNSRFWGFPGLMCFNCEYKDKNIIIINLYGKYYRKNNESILDNMYIFIEYIVKNNSDNKIIILAGDFNAGKQPTRRYPNGSPHNINFFNNLEVKLNFENCTKNMNTTEWGFQNDYIFINKNNDIKYKSKDPVYVLDSNGKQLTDHLLIECEFYV
jgi:hypothetical protein